MNQIDFTHIGGFPFDQSTLKFLQDSISNTQSLAKLGGPLAIISGCEVVGANANNGIVVINGEVLPFVGGVITAKVIVVNTPSSLTYQDGFNYPVIGTRTATFGDDGIQNNLWVSFKRNTPEGVLSRLDRVEKLLLPLSAGGGMLLWNRPFANIPDGWREVTDWRGRLPMGYDPGDADFNAVGNAGGSKNHTNTIAEMAAHTHTIDLFENGAGNSSGEAAVTDNNTVPKGTGASESTGLGTPYSILNPYRIVVFIEPIPGSF